MAWQVEFSESAERELRKLDAPQRKRILKFLQERKQLKDRHGFERLLELQNVKRRTAEWDALWKYFYDDET